MYKKYIKNFNRQYRFDFAIFINNEIKFVEIFSITGNEKYDERKEDKIKVCKENRLKLIQLTNYHIINNDFKALYKIIKEA